MQNKLKQEKGIALVITMMLLLVMSVMVAGFMLSTTTEKQMGGNQVRYVEAMNVAEAGISEMAARLAKTGAIFIGEKTPTSANWEARVLNTTSLPTSTTTLKYYSSIQTGMADALPYTVSTVDGYDGKYALSVRYKTDPAQTGIYYYDISTGQQSLSVGPPFNAPNDKSAPVWVIRATGLVGNVRRTVEVEASKNILTCNVKSAVNCDQGVFVTGAFSVCGHNHPASIDYGEYGARDKGSNPPYCGSPVGAHELCMRTGITCDEAGCLAGIATSGGLIDRPGSGNSNTMSGDPPTIQDPAYAVKPIWEMLGCADEADMKRKYRVRTVSSVAELNGDYNGFIEFTNDLDVSTLGTSTAHGVYWCKKNFFGRSDFAFKGMIYGESDFDITSKFWVLGACVAKGDVNLAGVGQPRGRGMHFRGNGDCLYSSEVLQNELSNGTSAGLKQLGWREINL